MNYYRTIIELSGVHHALHNDIFTYQMAITGTVQTLGGRKYNIFLKLCRKFPKFLFMIFMFSIKIHFLLLTRNKFIFNPKETNNEISVEL